MRACVRASVSRQVSVDWAALLPPPDTLRFSLPLPPSAPASSIDCLALPHHHPLIEGRSVSRRERHVFRWPLWRMVPVYGESSLLRDQKRSCFTASFNALFTSITFSGLRRRAVPERIKPPLHIRSCQRLLAVLAMLLMRSRAALHSASFSLRRIRTASLGSSRISSSASLRACSSRMSVSVSSVGNFIFKLPSSQARVARRAGSPWRCARTCVLHVIVRYCKVAARLRYLSDWPLSKQDRHVGALGDARDQAVAMFASKYASEYGRRFKGPHFYRATAGA